MFVLGTKLVLSAVFLVAGFGKLVDYGNWRRALANFGVPDPFVQALAALIPVMELAVGLSLLPAATGWWGAVGALFLFGAFAATVSANLATGRRPECRCFGQISSTPIGWKTLLSNICGASAALFLVLNPRTSAESAVGWVANFSAVEAIAGLAALTGSLVLTVQAFLMLQIMRQQGRILIRFDELDSGRSVQPGNRSEAARSHGLPVGSAAPDFRLHSMDGRSSSLAALLAGGKPVMLIFAAPNCGPCLALLPDIGAWQRRFDSVLTIALISEGSAAANRPKIVEHKLQHVYLQNAREVADLYLAAGTPAAALITAEGLIQAPLAFGAEFIADLVAVALGLRTPAGSAAQPAQRGAGEIPNAGAAHSVALAKGSKVPSLLLMDSEKRTVDLATLGEQETVLLFWSMRCGFCRNMLGELRAWELAVPESAPKLMLISSEEVGEHESLQLRSPLLLDRSASVAAKFGANGTPMAVRIDAHGRVASDLAIGAASVMNLLGSADLQEEVDFKVRSPLLANP